jgi:hypothetical protein
MIARTFQGVFPNSSLWFAQTFGSWGNSNALLIGSVGERGIDYGILEARFRDERITSDLRSEGIDGIIEFLDCFVMGEETLAEYVGGDTEITTDDHPLLEFGTVEMHYSEILAELASRRESVRPYLENLTDDSGEVLDGLVTQYAVSNRCIEGDLGFIVQDFNKAVAGYSAALLMSPADGDVRSQYLEVQARALKHIAEKVGGMNEPDARAVQRFLRTARVDLDDAEALFGMGFLFQKIGWLDAAIGQYREALRLASENLRIRNNLAIVYDRKGWSDKALQELEAIISMDPRFAEPYAYSGYIHEKLGNKEKAIELYEKALEIDPSNSSAKKHLAGLK